MSPISCPPMAPLMEVHAPSQALLWKNSSTDCTDMWSWNPMERLTMMFSTEESPLHTYEAKSTVIMKLRMHVIPKWLYLATVCVIAWCNVRCVVKSTSIKWAVCPSNHLASSPGSPIFWMSEKREREPGIKRRVRNVTHYTCNICHIMPDTRLPLFSHVLIREPGDEDHIHPAWWP